MPLNALKIKKTKYSLEGIIKTHTFGDNSKYFIWKSNKKTVQL